MTKYPITLSSENKSISISPDPVYVAKGDVLSFTAKNANFLVRFNNASIIMENVDKADIVYKVTPANPVDTDPFHDIIYDSYSYQVEILKEEIKAPAKMTVKAIISRNG
jgi:hypothetical protein